MKNHWFTKNTPSTPKNGAVQKKQILGKRKKNKKNPPQGKKEPKQ